MQIALLAVTIILLAASQITQKLAAKNVHTGGKASDTALSMAKSGGFWLSAVLLASAMATWLLTLATAEVSKAYPMLATSFKSVLLPAPECPVKNTISPVST